jgi:hypothetical protein
VRNDHVAPKDDLAALHRAGVRVIPLDVAVDWLDGSPDQGAVEKAVVLTFDDGCDFDVRDLEYPGHGLQRSFLGILEDFRQEAGAATQPVLHATSFVIASREARRVIDKGSLFGHGWISDDWWQEIESAGLISIENHGWDHNHPDLAGAVAAAFTVDTHEQCLQVVRAAGAIKPSPDGGHGTSLTRLESSPIRESFSRTHRGPWLPRAVPSQSRYQSSDR